MIKLKKVDFSDIRILLVGVILLLIPVAFLLFTLSQDTRGGFGQSSAQERLMNRKAVFNFAPPAPTSMAGGPGGSSGVGGGGTGFPGGSSGGAGSYGTGAGAGGGLSGGGGPAYAPEAVNRELEEALKILERAPQPEINIPGMTPDQKLGLQADLNPSYRKGCGQLEYNDLAAAEQAFRDAIDQSSNNPFLRMNALGGLVEVYHRQGRQKELGEALARFAEAVKNLPGGTVGDLPTVMKNAARLFEQMRTQIDPGKLSEALSKAGPLPQGVRVDAASIKAAVDQSLQNFPLKALAGGEQ